MSSQQTKKNKQSNEKKEDYLKTPLGQRVKEFLEYIEIEKNRSWRTRNNYKFYLKRFTNWLRQKKSSPAPADITAEKVRQYRLWLNRLGESQGKTLKKSTQNYHLIALRAFLKYLAKRDIKTLAPEKIELAKIPERSVEFLEGSDLEHLLEAPLRNKRGQTLAEDDLDIISLRDKAILELLFSTGLRVSELTNLKIENINLKKDEFSVRGKGDKPRVVFLSAQAKYWLKKYLNKRANTALALFVSHDKAGKKLNRREKALTPRSIQRLIEKYSKLAGLTKKVTPHTMRHSYATDLLMNGADIRSVQAMLGHSSITTTQIYTHITNRQLRDIHKNFHGKDRKK